MFCNFSPIVLFMTSGTCFYNVFSNSPKRAWSNADRGPSSPDFTDLFPDREQLRISSCEKSLEKQIEKQLFKLGLFARQFSSVSGLGSSFFPLSYSDETRRVGLLMSDFILANSSSTSSFLFSLKNKQIYYHNNHIITE